MLGLRDCSQPGNDKSIVCVRPERGRTLELVVESKGTFFPPVLQGGTVMVTLINRQNNARLTLPEQPCQGNTATVTVAIDDLLDKLDGKVNRSLFESSVVANVPGSPPRTISSVNQAHLMRQKAIVRELGAP